MSNDQEQRLRILDNAMWRLSRSRDCEYDDEQDPPKPCDCPRCIATAALEAAKSWRFHGAHHARTRDESFPREAKMQAAWMKLALRNGGGPDHLLTQILQEDHVPSVRDWYVATSIVQWLATNVGMTVLEAAGFKYQQWDQDLASEGLFRRRQDREAPAKPPAKPTACSGSTQEGGVNCQECDSGTPRYLDEHTGVWLHAVTIEGVAGGFVVCKDPCRVDTGTPKSCALGTEGCGIAHQLGTTVELSTTIDARKADR